MFAVLALGWSPGGICQEGRAALLAKENTSQAAHAEFFDHAAGDLTGAVEIAGRAVGNLPINQLFGDGAAQANFDVALQLRLGLKVAIILGSLQHVPQGPDAAR